MPPKAFADLREIDLDQVQFGPEEIRARNPHRHEFELLDAVIAYLPDQELIVGAHRADPEGFWVRGHIPGRPLFPGVLMIEAAAQLCSFYWREAFPEHKKFFGFGGIKATRFRGVVAPGDRLIIIGKPTELRPRRATFDVQGFVGDEMVFESTIIGMPF